MSFIITQFHIHTLRFIFSFFILILAFSAWKEYLFLGSLRNFFFAFLIILLILKLAVVNNQISQSIKPKIIPPLSISVIIFSSIFIFRYISSTFVRIFFEERPTVIEYGFGYLISTYLDFIPILLYISFIQLNL